MCFSYSDVIYLSHHFCCIDGKNRLLDFFLWIYGHDNKLAFGSSRLEK